MANEKFEFLKRGERSLRTPDPLRWFFLVKGSEIVQSVIMRGPVRWCAIRRLVKLGVSLKDWEFIAKLLNGCVGKIGFHKADRL